MSPMQDMPRDEFTAEAFFKGFTEGWTIAGGDDTFGSCPVPEPHFDEVEYLIDQVRTCLASTYAEVALML